MATQRIIDYWHTPAPEAFVDYVLRRAGLVGDYLKIARNYWSEPEGDTVYYADKVCLDKKDFNRKSGTMHKAVVPVLIELAIDGWKARIKETSANAKV